MHAPIARANILALATAYADATGMTVDQISKKFYGRTDFIGSFVVRKASISVDKLDAIIAKFEANWPEGAPWPQLHDVTVNRRTPPASTGKSVPRGAGAVAKSDRIA